MSQPYHAIPPLTEEGVQKLVGKKCAVQRLSNKSKLWWVSITAVRFFDAKEAVLTIAGHRSFGRSRQVRLSKVRWRNHIDDTLVLAIVKARGERSKA